MLYIFGSRRWRQSSQNKLFITEVLTQRGKVISEKFIGDGEVVRACTVEYITFLGNGKVVHSPYIRDRLIQ